MTSPRPSLPDVVFDIGNVILFFDFGIFGRRIAPFCGCPAAELEPRLREPAWELEARGLPPDEFYRKAVSLVEYRGTKEAFVRAWQEIFTPNVPVIDWIGELDRRGHRLFLLSNTNPWHVEYFWDRYPVFATFRDRVFSHEERRAKPEPEIYAAAARRFGIEPSRTIYLDDRPENVAAGAAAGWNSILYSGQNLADDWPDESAPVNGSGR
jgi:HAD superfamily hydrolase (TIGR01509 family)